MWLRKQTATLAARAWRLLALLTVVVGASATTLLAVALAAGTGSGGDRPGSGFAILAHPRSATPFAAVGGLAPPQGASLAAISDDNAVYAWQPSSVEVCVILLEKAGAGGVACAQTQQAEADGVLLTVRPAAGSVDGATVTTAVLVPDGVGSVSFADRDGTVHPAAVENNVAVLNDPNLKSVDYTLPDGSQYAQTVPPVSAGAAAARAHRSR
jgi:hypothetical protein